MKEGEQDNIENDRQTARRLLQKAGIEIDASDHRTAIQVAQAFGLIGIDGANEYQSQEEVTQSALAVRKKDSPIWPIR
jgi:hypothetical protein